jgi:DNA-binding CsgD family transcriptional regulator
MIIDKHPFLEMANDIDDICKPLRQFGVHLYSYRKTFRDGSRINVSNNANWLEDYFRLELYKSSLFESDIDCYSSGFSVWPQESNLPIFVHGRTYYNSDNGITLILKDKDYCEYFIFGADPHKKQMIDFYINNLELIRSFTEYFHEQSNDLLKKATNNLIRLNPIVKEPSQIQQIYNKIDSVSIKQLFPKKKRTNQPISQSIQLSPRELSCIQYLLKGKTAKEIANHLNLSYRTIEYYLEIIRSKTGCRNKYELIAHFSTYTIPY